MAAQQQSLIHHVQHLQKRCIRRNAGGLDRGGGRTVLDQIKLDVYRGETLVILGGSGSGKSTLLRVMIGNERPNAGDVICLGKSLRGMTPAELTARLGKPVYFGGYLSEVDRIVFEEAVAA